MLLNAQPSPNGEPPLPGLPCPPDYFVPSSPHQQLFASKSPPMFSPTLAATEGVDPMVKFLQSIGILLVFTMFV